MAGWTPDTTVEQAALALAVFGAGFGLTVTPRSTAAVEAVARDQFGVASSTVTVARMVGMAVGLAILTAYGSTTIDQPLRPGLRDARRLPGVHPRVAPGPAAPRRAGRRGARGVGRRRGGPDHGRRVPRRGGGDGRRRSRRRSCSTGRRRMLGPAAARPRRPPAPRGALDGSDERRPDPALIAGRPADASAIRRLVERRTRRLGAARDDARRASLADPEARVWVDVTAPSPSTSSTVAELLGLHPLIAEDIAERNQRAKVEEVDGMIHIVAVRDRVRGRGHRVEIDLVLGHRSLLTVHEPGWDPLTLPQLRGDPGSAPQAGPGLPAVRDRRRHRRRLLPGPRRARRRDRRAPGRRHREPDDLDAASGCSRSSAS